jgi:hypothetical protein
MSRRTPYKVISCPVEIFLSCRENKSNTLFRIRCVEEIESAALDRSQLRMWDLRTGEPARTAEATSTIADWRPIPGGCDC